MNGSFKQAFFCLLTWTGRRDSCCWHCKNKTRIFYSSFAKFRLVSRHDYTSHGGGWVASSQQYDCRWQRSCRGRDPISRAAPEIRNYNWILTLNATVVQQ
jgi:hypothetical protein